MFIWLLAVSLATWLADYLSVYLAGWTATGLAVCLATWLNICVYLAIWVACNM